MVDGSNPMYSYILSGIAFFILLIACINFVNLTIARWYFTNKWLENYPYRVNLSWWIFTLAGIMVILIAMITVSFQAFKAAISNPVKNLRTE